MQKKLNIASSIVIYLFNPVVISSLGVFIIFNSGTIYSFYNAAIKNYVYYTIIGLTFVIPLIIYSIIPVLRKFYTISLSLKHERAVPMLIMAVVHSYAYSILRNHQILALINTFLLAIITSNIIFLIINIFTHSHFQIGLLGTLVALILKINIDIPSILPYLLQTSIVVTAIVASAILSTNKTKFSTIAYSFLTGFCIALILLFSL